MKLKQMNKGHRCPNCKKFGLEPRTHYMSTVPAPDVHGHCSGGFKFFRCRNCYAEFEEVKQCG